MPKKKRKARRSKEDEEPEDPQDEEVAAVAAEDEEAPAEAEQQKEEEVSGAPAAGADGDEEAPSLELLTKTQNGKVGWTDEADTYIMSYVERHGKRGAVWDELSDRFGGMRSASGVRSRWYMLAGPSANIKGGWVQKRKKPNQSEDDPETQTEATSGGGGGGDGDSSADGDGGGGGGGDGDGDGDGLDREHGRASPDGRGASPSNDGSGVARTSSGGKKKQRIESASELGIATHTSAGDVATPAATAPIGPPLPQRPGRTAFYLAGVAPHLTCTLCDKLFTDAHTICECLHTFCKTCVQAHIEEHRACPICGIKVRTGATAPPIRGDRALQSLVDKINAVLKEQRPGGDDDEDEDDENDMPLRMMSPTNKERTARKALAVTVAREEGNNLRITLTPVPTQEQAANASSGAGGAGDTASAAAAAAGTGSASAEARAGSPTSQTSPTRLPPRKLRRSRLAVSDRTTVFHLKQFLAAAFAVRSLKQVEILCVGAALGDDMSLEYVLKTHWRGHAEDELLALHYQMREER
jgi:hypothetical protein